MLKLFRLAIIPKAIAIYKNNKKEHAFCLINCILGNCEITGHWLLVTGKGGCRQAGGSGEVLKLFRLAIVPKAIAIYKNNKKEHAFCLINCILGNCEITGHWLLVTGKGGCRQAGGSGEVLKLFRLAIVPRAIAIYKNNKKEHAFCLINCILGNCEITGHWLLVTGKGGCRQAGGSGEVLKLFRLAIVPRAIAIYKNNKKEHAFCLINCILGNCEITGHWLLVTGNCLTRFSSQI